MEIWLIVAMIVLLLIVGVAVYVLRKDNQYEPDYRVFFILGVTWLPIGIATDNSAFIGMGAVFMVLGLANRSKWKERTKFAELPEERRRLKISLIIGLTLLVLFLAGALFLTR
jgi:uncharacterized membrane protein YidH (DUF202 family)